MEKETFNQWGLLELFGHQQIAGLISEQSIGGASFVRIDVPATSDGSHQAFTRFLGASAIYAINPLSEETARMKVDTLKAAPITAYDLSAKVRDMVEERVARLAPSSTTTRRFSPGGEPIEGDDVNEYAENQL